MGEGLKRICRMGMVASVLGGEVADLLDCLYAGLYHLPDKVLRKTIWSNSHWIEVVVDDGPYATYDFDYLTSLVFLCHQRAIRCEVNGARQGLLRLRFHKRRREGQRCERHPTMAEAVAECEKAYGL